MLKIITMKRKIFLFKFIFSFSSFVFCFSYNWYYYLSKETIPIYFYWPYENNDTYSSTALTSTIKIIGRQYTGTSATLPINMLGLDFTVKTGGGSCRRDSYEYNTIGTTCSNYYRRETIDSTHGYFTY